MLKVIGRISSSHRLKITTNVIFLFSSDNGIVEGSEEQNR